MRKILNRTIPYVLLLVLLTSGCGTAKSDAGSVSTQPVITTYTYAEGSYDSCDTAIVTAVNTAENTVTFRNLTVHREYTLQFTDTSVINNKYGTRMYLSAVMPGDMVEVKFLKDEKTITSIRYLTEVVTGDEVTKYWTDEEVTNFSFEESGTGMTIGQEHYTFSDDLLIFYGEEQLTLADLDACDVLTVRGIDNTVYSISVTKGHGYLRLSGDSYFIGGWIEIGNSIIRRISEDMVIAVPEGDYTVRLSNGGNVGTKEVSILRGSEMTLDVSDIAIEDTGYCVVTFHILPEEADAGITVDGNYLEEPTATLDYGVHQLLIMADGYEAAIMYLKVGSSSYDFTYTLTAKESEEDSTEETETTDTEDTSDTTTDTDSTGTSTDSTGTTTSSSTSTSSDSDSTAYVLITEPVDVEVYVDGSYIGITPTLFKKEAGSHVVTLRRTGYQTRSYTITLDSSDDDEEYTFVDLLSLE